MKGFAFDRLVGLVGSASTRRTALKMALGGTTVASAGLASAVGGTNAKKKHKKCKKCQGVGFGEECNSNKDCCANETNLSCGVPNGGSPALVCCGGLNAPCSDEFDCCWIFG